MPSLKSLLDQLSPILGMSPGAIYERQRALVRLGALHAAPGKGPGSGVELSSQNLATLLIGCAAFMSLSSIDDRIVEYIQARSSGKGCMMTGAKTFGLAIQGILEEKFAKNFPYPRDMHVCFNLQAPGGFIYWLDQPVHAADGWKSSVPLISSFGKKNEPGEQPGIDFRSYVSRKILFPLKDLLITAGAS
jgi:hypothetical protein